MKKQKKPTVNSSWDDDAPIAATKKVSKAATAKQQEETHAAIARAAKRAGSRGLPAESIDDLIGKPSIDDLIGEPDDLIGKPSVNDLIGNAPFAGARLKTITVDRGVYLDPHRSSAIVTNVANGKVQAVYLRGTGIEMESCSDERFAHDFCIALPHYPIRRAARIYLNSPIPKAATAERELRALLRA